MKNRKNQSVLYINYAPYGNTGNILTYMRDTFRTVIYIEFIFHHLGKMQSAIYHYQLGKLVKVESISQIPIPATYVFIALPIRSFINFLQIIFHSIRLYRKYHKFDIFFSVNAFISWCGNILKNLGIVTKTIFWVWDYYPPIHEDKMVMFIRSIYWTFDKAAISSDRVIFLNNRLLELRRKIGILPKGKKYPIVGIGTVINKTIKRALHKPLRIAYLGAVKKSQGLDFIFDHAEYIVKKSHSMEIHVFGGGPDEERFKKRASRCPIRCIFHGYISDSGVLEKSLSQCDVGLALYMPDPGNVSYYGDPSKIKAYISLGMPVITTDVFWFVNELQKAHAGIITPYEPVTFTKGLLKIVDTYAYYSNNAYTLAARYNYKNLYETLFS